MKINVVGVSGSGKSTLSQRLAAIFNVPYIHMDQLFWKENWGHTPEEELRQKLKEKMEEDPAGWVIDGNYTRTCDFKWKEVEWVIWLDYGFLRTMYQIITRSIWRAWSQVELWPGTGNRESFWQTFFTRDSMIWWTWTHYWPNKQRLEADMVDEKWKHIRFIRLRSPRETEEFLGKLEKKKYRPNENNYNG